MKCWLVFHLEQIPYSIREHNVRWLNMVVKRSNISLNKDVQWMSDEMLDHLTRASNLGFFVNLPKMSTASSEILAYLAS